MDVGFELREDGVVLYEGRELVALPKRLRILFKDLLVAGDKGIDPGAYNIKRKSMASNYMLSLRIWLMENQLPYRIICTERTGCPWETVKCPSCGHVKKIRAKGRPKGRYIFEPIPPRPTRKPTSEVRNEVG